MAGVHASKDWSIGVGWKVPPGMVSVSISLGIIVADF